MKTTDNDTAGAALAALLRATPAQRESSLMQGEAWSRFCDTLKSVGADLLTERQRAPIDCADAFHYLAGLAVAGIKQAFDHADPDAPKWSTFPDSFSRWGAENPDNRYLRAALDPQKSYRLYGNCGDCHDVLFEVSEGYMQLGKLKNFATMSMRDFTVEANGDIEIIVSPAEHGGNWLPLDPQAHHLVVREYYYDWNEAAPAWFALEPLECETAPPADDAAAVAARIADAGLWIEQTAAYWKTWVDEVARQSQPGVFNQARAYPGGAKDIMYGNNFYQLEEDEALLIEGEPPQALYWQFSLINNAFVTMDYTNRQASLNGRQIHLDSDGRFRVVLAHRDPGVPNWLDTGGRLTGMLQFRWISTRNNPVLKATKIRCGQLRERLPADTPVVSPPQRRAAVAARQRHMAIRERRV
jgi:hypothetical protein